MPTLVSSEKDKSLLHRLFEPVGKGLTVPAAKYFLNVHFSESDHERMRELLKQSKLDKLSEAEQEELEEYERVGCILDLLHSKARITLKKRSAAH